jgi:acetylornithine deacetylase/succinyl-diaminopimelate desuccinylase-like protein
MANTKDLLDHVDAHLDDARARLFDLLSIPSVSAQPAHAGDCRQAAEWLRRELEGMGFEASVRDTVGGHPVTMGHHPGPGGDAPHILFYGHYDVQPPEPLELWRSSPFAPVLEDGPNGPRIVARGAVDDKGQSMMWLEAFRAYHALTGTMPVRVTVLIEGEEEIGSPHLGRFLADHRDELKADVVVISDTDMWDIDTPAITTRLRGSTFVEVTLRLASQDMHSGLFGGAAQNAATVLARVLGSIHDEDGRVRIPGFYDGITPVSPEILASWNALDFDEAAFLGSVGLETPAGEKGRSALERLWDRPSVDVMGIWGGYTGEGIKTVIPAQASAKIGFRLVPGQDPEAVTEGFRKFIEDRLPAEGKLTFNVLMKGRGLAIPADSQWTKAAIAALQAEFQRPPVLMGCAGSIPVVEMFKEILGLDSLLVGFCLNDDQMHSPNEKFDMVRFHKGQRAHVRMLAEFGGQA